MPIYDYLCPNCGEKKDIWAAIKEDIIPCHECGAGMTRLISCAAVIGDIEPYIDYNMAHEGVFISSRQQHKAEMKKRGLVEYHPFGPKIKYNQKQRWI